MPRAGDTRRSAVGVVPPFVNPTKYTVLNHSRTLSQDMEVTPLPSEFEPWDKKGGKFRFGSFLEGKRFECVGEGRRGIIPCIKGAI